MKVLTNYQDLVGKTIKFAHMAQFANQITLVTTDNEIMMVKFISDEYEDDLIHILNMWNIVSAIDSSEYLQKELALLEVFDLSEFKKEQEQRQQESMRLAEQARENGERAEYERLKKKYEVHSKEEQA